MIQDQFVPLKISIEPGTKEFPSNLPGLSEASFAYRFLGGENNDGFTGVMVLTSDGKIALASTGSAFVWELLEATAYNADRLLIRIQTGLDRFKLFDSIQNDQTLDESARQRKMRSFLRNVARARRSEDPLRLPPRGFTIENAKELFRLSGDLKED